MKYIYTTVICCLFSVAVIAGQDEYDDCILKYLKGAKIDVATHLIMQACKENYKSTAFTSERKKAFNQCILENLAGVESVPAAMEIKAVCDRKSRKGIK